MRRFMLLFGIFGFMILASVQIAAKFPFKGEHIYVSGMDVNCSKCHVKEAQGMAKSAYHHTLTCRDCHAIGNPYRTGETAQSHSATVITCTVVGCHDNVTAKINSTYEAHRGLFQEAITHTSIFGTYKENEACLACHANYARNITFVYPEYINFSIVINWSDRTTIPSCTNNNTRKYDIGYLKRSSNLRVVTVTFPERDIHNLVNLSDINCSGTCHNYIATALNQFYQNHASDVADKGTDVGHSSSIYDDAYCNTCHRNLSFSTNPYVHSNEVHVAESIECIDCHRSGGVFDITQQEPLGGGEHACRLYSSISTYPKKFQADICLSCHFRVSHSLDTSGCLCHSPVDSLGNPSIGENISGYINFTIYSEPSGDRNRSITLLQ